MNSILICIFFALVVIPYQGETKPHRRKLSADSDEDLTAGREAQYYCFKLKSCTPGGPKVCGFDQYKPWLVQFEDMCTLYRTNCKNNGKFYPVDQIVCDTRIQYDKEHANETFEVIHIRPTGATDRPVVRYATTVYRQIGTELCKPVIKFDEASTAYYGQAVKKEEFFSSYYCYKQATCISGGEKVCGISIQKETLAVFKDLCYFYSMNCKNQEGHFLQTGMERCNNANDTILYGINPIKSEDVTWASKAREPVIKSSEEQQSRIEINYTLHV